MSRNFLMSVLSAAVLLCMQSCLNSDDTDVTYSDDTSITSFSLGNICRVYTSQSGADSLGTGVSFSSYKFNIDQARHEVYNTDSLPYYAVGPLQMKKVLSSISTKNSGIAVYQAVDDTTWYNFRSTDSLDFSVPRHFRVYSASLNYYQDWTIRVNVHQVPQDTFIWHNRYELPALENARSVKGIALGDSVYLYVQRNGSPVLLAASASGDAQFAEHSVSLSAEAAGGMIVYDGRVYTISDGSIVSAPTPAAAFSAVASAKQLSRLLGATRHDIYALSADGAIMISRDGGMTWQADSLDSSSDLLPSGNINFVSQPDRTNSGLDRAVLTGSRSESDSTAVVWNKLSGYGAEDSPWQYLEVSGDNQYRLPAKSVSMTVYRDSLEAFDGVTLFKSRDLGLTWYPDDKISRPDCFAAASEPHLILADRKGNLWLVSGGVVWKGRRD